MDPNFLMPKISAKFRWDHPNGGTKYRWGELKWAVFRPVYSYITETMSERYILTVES